MEERGRGGVIGLLHALFREKPYNALAQLEKEPATSNTNRTYDKKPKTWTCPKAAPSATCYTARQHQTLVFRSARTRWYWWCCRLRLVSLMFFFFSFFFFSFFNTVPLHSLKYNSEQLNRRNRGLFLITSWSKESILIKDCRD